MAVIELYNTLSKRFIIIIEKIGESADQERYKNSRVMPEQVSRTE